MSFFCKIHLYCTFLYSIDFIKFVSFFFIFFLDFTCSTIFFAMFFYILTTVYIVIVKYIYIRKHKLFQFFEKATHLYKEKIRNKESLAFLLTLALLCLFMLIFFLFTDIFFLFFKFNEGILNCWENFDEKKQ